MEVHQHSSKEYFKILSIIHLFLVLGILLLGIVISIFIADFQHPDTDSKPAILFVYLVPGLAMAGIVASNVMFNIKLNALKERMDLKTKMLGYRESLIIRYAIIQASALFALVAIFVTNNINFIIYAGLLVVLLMFKRPSMKSAINDLKLDQHEIAVLEDPDSAIF